VEGSVRFTTRDQANDFLRSQNREICDEGMRIMRSLVDSLTPEELAARNTCCPEWSNQDVVAHHIHFAGAETFPDTILTALREPDQAAYEASLQERDGWTGAGVAARRGRSLRELWDEWDAIREANPDEHYPTVDLTMHLFDIEESLDRVDRERPELAFDALLGYVNWFLVDKLRAAGEELTIRPTDIDHEIAFFDDAPAVSGTAYDLLRCVGGRRTRAEADTLLEWGSTSEQARSLLSVYTWPTDRIEVAP
jgi:uncharacterized protein (TIGR03083 family)